MLTLSLKLKLTSDDLAVLRILPETDVINEDTRFLYVGIQHFSERLYRTLNRSRLRVTLRFGYANLGSRKPLTNGSAIRCSTN
jgi:hypothetical protein